MKIVETLVLYPIRKIYIFSRARVFNIYKATRFKILKLKSLITNQGLKIGPAEKPISGQFRTTLKNNYEFQID